MFLGYLYGYNQGVFGFGYVSFGYVFFVGFSWFSVGYVFFVGLNDVIFSIGYQFGFSGYY